MAKLTIYRVTGIAVIAALGFTRQGTESAIYICTAAILCAIYGRD